MKELKLGANLMFAVAVDNSSFDEVKISSRLRKAVDWIGGFAQTLGNEPANFAVKNLTRPKHEIEVEQTMFAYTVSSLAAKLMQVDGYPNNLETKSFISLFSFSGVAESKLRSLLGAAAKDNAPYQQYARQLHRLYINEPDMRRDVFMRLAKVALADAPLTHGEYDFLLNVGQIIGFDKMKIACLVSESEGKTKDLPHKLLRVAANASAGEIQIAYHERMKYCHPDRWLSSGEYKELYLLLNAKAQSINAAYVELMRHHGVKVTHDLLAKDRKR